MTVRARYNVAMNILSSTASGGVIGFFWAIILFFLCFLAIHSIKLIRLGLKALNEPKNEPIQQEKKPADRKSGAEKEPIYYIVERKKRRAKTSYTEPKEFRFK